MFMEKMTFDKSDDLKLEMNFRKACEDKTFRDIAKKLDLSPEILMRYTSTIKDCVKEFENCKNCKGIESCKNSIKGSMLVPIKQGSGVTLSYESCKKKLDEQYKENISLYDLPISLKNANMKDILLDGNRKEVLKEVQAFYKDYLAGKNPKGLYLVGNFGTGKSYIIEFNFPNYHYG